jgi:hypothetical protein
MDLAVYTAKELKWTDAPCIRRDWFSGGCLSASIALRGSHAYFFTRV